MLKYVSFWVTEKGASALLSARQNVAGMLAAEGISMQIKILPSTGTADTEHDEIGQGAAPTGDDRDGSVIADPLNFASGDLLKETAAGKEELQNIADTLFITDDSAILHHLLEQGCFTAGYHHESNRGISMDGARYVVEDIAELESSAYFEIYARLAHLPLTILQTDRLIIRESTAGDVPEFYRIYQDPAMTRYMEKLFEDPQAEIAYIQEYIRNIYGFYGYGIWSVLKKDGTLIGRAGISLREGYELPELGFLIGVPYQRQGYALEACRAILTYAEQTLSFHEMQALVIEENVPSVHLLKKLGFAPVQTVNEKGTEYLLMKYGTETCR